MKHSIPAFCLLLIISYTTSEPCKKFNAKDWSQVQDVDNDCQNTHQEVLIDEGSSVTFQTDNECKVKGGDWYDYFTDKDLTNPSRIVVIPYVSFEEAHQSGAHNWSLKKKLEYANFLADTSHLIAVHKSGVPPKGGKDIAEWRPKNELYHKEYIKTWAAIKYKWKLTANKVELDLIKETLPYLKKLPVEAPECEIVEGTAQN